MPISVRTFKDGKRWVHRNMHVRARDREPPHKPLYKGQISLRAPPFEQREVPRRPLDIIPCQRERIGGPIREIQFCSPGGIISGAVFPPASVRYQAPAQGAVSAESAGSTECKAVHNPFGNRDMAQ